MFWSRWFGWQSKASLSLLQRWAECSSNGPMWKLSSNERKLTYLSTSAMILIVLLCTASRVFYFVGATVIQTARRRWGSVVCTIYIIKLLFWGAGFYSWVGDTWFLVWRWVYFWFVLGGSCRKVCSLVLDLNILVHFVPDCVIINFESRSVRFT